MIVNRVMGVVFIWLASFLVDWVEEDVVGKEGKGYYNILINNS